MRNIKSLTLGMQKQPPTVGFRVSSDHPNPEPRVMG